MLCSGLPGLIYKTTNCDRKLGFKHQIPKMTQTSGLWKFAGKLAAPSGYDQLATCGHGRISSNHVSGKKQQDLNTSNEIFTEGIH